MPEKPLTSWPQRCRLQYHLLRARCSAPALLARCDEKKAVARLATIHAALAIGAISLTAWLTDLPLLFPALGPSSFILFTTPLAVTAAPRNVVSGHWLCLALGLLVCRSLAAIAGQPPPDWLPYAAAALALALACWAMVRLGINHPPACASALVVALGSVASLPEILLMAAAVAWLTFQAVLLNRLAGLPVPRWAPRSPTHASHPCIAEPRA